jgi:CRISPR-associated exonuclease Cas4
MYGLKEGERIPMKSLKKYLEIGNVGTNVADDGLEEERQVPDPGYSMCTNTDTNTEGVSTQSIEVYISNDLPQVSSIPRSHNVEDHDLHVTGTLMWYYHICKRQVWLMAHQINPDEDDSNIAYGRFLQEISYKRAKKEAAVGNCRFDLVQQRDGTIIVSEVKKTSRHLKSATMQLLFYLKELRERGVEATGELRFPEEKRRKSVMLTEEALREVLEAEKGIIEVIKGDLPPKPFRMKLCRNCGYAEFCWS